MSVENELDEAHLTYLQYLLDAGCKLKYRTVLFGKEYVWMVDKFGSTFLERLPNTEETPGVRGMHVSSLDGDNELAGYYYEPGASNA